LIKPQYGIYKNQYHIIEMKTQYGSEDHQYGASTVTYSYQYPKDAPMMRFLTKIFHTNISSQGSICLDTLKEPEKWAPSNSFETLIYNILLLLELPNNASPFNSQAQREYVACEKEYKSKYDKNMTIAEQDRLKESCFEEFKNYTIRVAGSNNLHAFSKWFPFTVDYEQKMYNIDEFNALYISELEELEKSISKKTDLNKQNDKVDDKKKIDEKKIVDDKVVDDKKKIDDDDKKKIVEKKIVDDDKVVDKKIVDDDKVVDDKKKDNQANKPANKSWIKYKK
jgi:ubiquitin-protein ligase